MSDDNPYASPVTTECGEWDHSLFWQIVRMIAKSAMLLVFCDALLLARYHTEARAAMTIRPTFCEMMEMFVSGKSIQRITE